MYRLTNITLLGSTSITPLDDSFPVAPSLVQKLRRLSSKIRAKGTFRALYYNFLFHLFIIFLAYLAPSFSNEKSNICLKTYPTPDI